LRMPKGKGRFPRAGDAWERDPGSAEVEPGGMEHGAPHLKDTPADDYAEHVFEGDLLRGWGDPDPTPTEGAEQAHMATADLDLDRVVRIDLGDGEPILARVFRSAAPDRNDLVGRPTCA